MQYLYSGGTHNLELTGNDADVLELMAAASFFQLEGLLRYTEARCAEIIDIDNVVAMYIHAKVSCEVEEVCPRSLISSLLPPLHQHTQVYNASKLMEYCQGFLLQNMVALLTYDDSVKRLLFAKKIPNHDVLSGLLATLQKRIESRRNAQSNAAPTTPVQNKGMKPASQLLNGKTSHHAISTANNINNSSSGLNKSSNNLTE
jgi:ankyrin repeat/BTB/POZ domain-containing protein 2